MADNPDTQADTQERGIPAVGQAAGDRDKYFMPLFLLFLMSAGLVLWFWTSLQDDAPPMTDQSDTEFDRSGGLPFTIPPAAAPEAPVLPEPAPLPATVLPAAPVPVEVAEIDQAAIDLRERRKRSPVIIYDGQLSAGAVLNPVEQRQQALLDRLNASVAPAPAGVGEETARAAGTDGGLEGQLQTTDVPAVAARLINAEQLPYIIAEGKLISAVLETAIQSDLPGKVRAVVADDVYSYNGERKLLEKGSRLVGEYQSGIRQGQVRVFVVWSRVITPHGVDVALASPGTGPLGRAGIGGWVDRHFLERFGASLLLSVIGAYTAREAASSSRQDAQIQREVRDSFNRLGEIALADSINIAPTINVNQGAYIRVFVARDLNFREAWLLNEQQKSKGNAGASGAL